MKHFQKLLAFIFLWASCSCLHHQTTTQSRQAEVLPLSISSQLEYPATPPKIIYEAGDECDDYRIHLYEFVTAKVIHPDKKNQNLVKFEVFECKEPLDGKPALIIHPISGGSYILARYFARHFSSRGWNCVVIKRYKLARHVIQPSSMNPVVRQIIINHKQVLDWLDSSPWKTDFIADLGVSKGALQSAMLTATDTRIKASVFMLGGGDLAYVLAHSREAGVTRRREQYMEQAGIDREEFHHQMIHSLDFDPLNFAKYMDSTTILHVLARFDLCVPYRSGQLLYEALPGSQKYTLLAGHYSALLFLPFITNETEEFLLKKYQEFLNRLDSTLIK